MTSSATRRKLPTGLLDALGHRATDKRIDLLRGIGRSGSISQAARDAGVSYKAAWQAVATLTQLAGVPLVDKAVGGAGGGGAVLTNEGARLLAMADEWAAARHALWPSPGAGAAVAHLAIRTSMRNQWPARVVQIEGRGPSLHVTLSLAGQLLQARITRESAELLGLSAGLPVLALCKATAVRVAPQADASDRAADVNRLVGVVSDARRGRGSAEGDEVTVRLGDGALEAVGFAAAARLRRGQRVRVEADPMAVVIALPA